MASGIAIVLAASLAYIVARFSRRRRSALDLRRDESRPASAQADTREEAPNDHGIQDVKASSPFWVRGPTALLSAPMLGVLAGLLYATLLSAYDAYYNEFGLEPDDVGLSYLEVLARAPVPLLYTLVLFAYALLVGAIIAFVVTLLVRAILQRLGEKHRQAVDRYFSRVRPVAVLGFATFAVGLTFFVGIRGEARSTGFMAAIYGDAVDAVEVEPEFPLLPTRMTMLEVKALPARLVFTRQGALTGLGDEGCLLYLGTANGVHALYDVSGRHALHVPASLVSVVTDRSEEAELPDRCNHIEEAR